jgi:hypothetical protein
VCDGSSTPVREGFLSLAGSIPVHLRFALGLLDTSRSRMATEALAMGAVPRLVLDILGRPRALSFSPVEAVLEGASEIAACGYIIAGSPHDRPRRNRSTAGPSSATSPRDDRV